MKTKTLSKQRRAIFIVASLLFLLILSSQVHAWGVYPARQHAKNTNELQNFHITLVNSEFKEGHFKVGFSGDLAKYAVYNGGLIHFTEEKNQASIPFSLQLQENLKPGKNVLTVVLQEVSNEYQEGVGSTVTLISEVVINIPLEGVVVSANLAIQPDGVSKPTKFNIGLLNKGDSAVPVWADVTVKGPTNEIIAQWKTEKQILAFGSTGGITTYWQGEKNPGMYQAEVTVHYGEEILVLRENFAVGNDGVIAEKINVNNFALGQIVPFEITGYNQWNSRRVGVFGEVFVVTKDGAIVQNFKTSPEDIGPMSRTTFQGYWDTSQLVVGEYDLNVLMHYEDKTTQQQFPVIVSIDDLKVMNRVSGQVISQGGSGGSSGSDENKLYKILVVLIIVLIVVNASWIIMMRRNNSGGGKKKK